MPGTNRLAGYLAAADRLGLATSAEMQVQADDFTYDAGLAGAATLLDQANPDAIVCANDLLAVATMKVLHRRGRRVPDDVAVVGMDDTELTELVHPSLTSVDLRVGASAPPRRPRLLLGRLAEPSLAGPPGRHRAVADDPRVLGADRRPAGGADVSMLTVDEVIDTTTTKRPKKKPRGGAGRRGRRRRRLEARPADAHPDRHLQRLPAASAASSSASPTRKPGSNVTTTSSGSTTTASCWHYDLFWESFRIGLIWTFSVTILQFVAALGLALLLNADLRFQWLARTLALVPWAMPPVIVAIMWRLMLQPELGPGQRDPPGLRASTSTINWLGDFTTALPAVIVVGVWVGHAADDDHAAGRPAIGARGAARGGGRSTARSTLRRFWHVTLPALRPVIVAITTLDLIWNFNSFALVSTC